MGLQHPGQAGAGGAGLPVRAGSAPGPPSARGDASVPLLLRQGCSHSRPGPPAPRWGGDCPSPFGVPSGLKLASCNITSPDQFGTPPQLLVYILTFSLYTKLSRALLFGGKFRC